MKTSIKIILSVLFFILTFAFIYTIAAFVYMELNPFEFTKITRVSIAVWSIFFSMCEIIVLWIAKHENKST